MKTEEYNKLSDIEKLRFVIERSIKSHEDYSSEFWKGSKHMAENILEAIESLTRKN